MYFDFQLCLLFLSLIISSEIISSYPVHQSETPIKKIVVRPVTQRNRRGNSQAIVRSGKAKNQSVPEMSPNSIIRVIDKSAVTLESFDKLRKNRTETRPIYYARAKVNGSFRNKHPIRGFPSETTPTANQSNDGKIIRAKKF